MFPAIAIHHAAPEHLDAFAAFLDRVVAAVGDAPGLLEFSSYAEAGGTRLFALSRWRSADAFQAALPTVLELGAERRPEWSTREDELLLMTAR
jgi:heme-degrading monooxygenase HmoA